MSTMLQNKHKLTVLPTGSSTIPGLQFIPHPPPNKGQGLLRILRYTPPQIHSLLCIQSLIVLNSYSGIQKCLTMCFVVLLTTSLTTSVKLLSPFLFRPGQGVHPRYARHTQITATELSNQNRVTPHMDAD